jgi:hypothetical protein
MHNNRSTGLMSGSQHLSSGLEDAATDESKEGHRRIQLQLISISFRWLPHPQRQAAVRQSIGKNSFEVLLNEKSFSNTFRNCIGRGGPVEGDSHTFVRLRKPGRRRGSVQKFSAPEKFHPLLPANTISLHVLVCQPLNHLLLCDPGTHRDRRSSLAPRVRSSLSRKTPLLGNGRVAARLHAMHVVKVGADVLITSLTRRKLGGAAQRLSGLHHGLAGQASCSKQALPVPLLPHEARYHRKHG